VHQPSHYLISSLKKLEFDRVVDRIGKLTVTELGRDRALKIAPGTDRKNIESELCRVSEMKELVIGEGGVPLEGTKNIIVALRKIAIENQVLSIQELLDIGSTLRASHAVHSFLAKRQAQYPSLVGFVDNLLVDKVVEFNIVQALDDQGFVKDSASKELKQIRQDLIVAGDALRKRLESILRKVSDQDFLQDEILTTRDGRMVIPVKVEHKTHVAGFIHSSSASGQTVYIEPAETLDLNNALRELQLGEQREIHRILSELTGQVKEIREPLETSLYNLVELDLLTAKAKYSIEILGNPPVLSESPYIKLIQARHPVLLQRHKRDEVIPLNFEIGGKTSTLLITGPNAGGKTVTLKTVGLLTLCSMAGIHIPAASDSQIFPFTDIFVDIGDDQSIESDLSTFSSHLLHMKEIVERADNETLVLIDEIGAGTDPAEGGALAASILRTLTRRKTTTVATTHDGLLKAFAHDSEGMDNASMEFDQSSLRPTYKFRLGIPGSSFAFELAQRIGVPENILAFAKENLGTAKERLESLILDLERESQSLKSQSSLASSEREKLASLREEYELKDKEFKNEISSLRKKAATEAKDLLRDAKATIEHVVKEIREKNARPEVVREMKQELRGASERVRKEAGEEVHVDVLTEVFKVGDEVRLQEGSQIGEIAKIHADSATVVWGHAKLQVPLRSLTKHIGKPQPVYGASRSDLPQIVAQNEIDLRGLMGDEAIDKVEQFLDNAYVSGLHRVDIIHGKGTGALRKRITAFLKSYPHAKSFRLGEWNEGGTGVTVVELS
jgi:DNA mismatch repair protein MutS2